VFFHKYLPTCFSPDLMTTNEFTELTHLSDPDSYYSSSSDISEEAMTSQLQVRDDSLGRMSASDIFKLELRRYQDFFCRQKWILTSLDMGIYREFIRWWNKNYVRRVPPEPIVQNVDDFRDHYEGLEGEEISILVSKQPNVIPRLSGSIARLCRLELYISDRPSEAEIIVIREWIVRHMNSRNIRKSTQSAILPYALKFSLIPTRDEIRAREMTLQPEYQERLNSQQPLYSRERPWLFNWFGRKIHEPVARTV